MTNTFDGIQVAPLWQPNMWCLALASGTASKGTWHSVTATTTWTVA